MRQQNTKATVPQEVVPERLIERCSPRFWPGGRFWSQVSATCRQAGRERLIIGSNSYIYKRIQVISSMWYVQVCLAAVHITIAHARLRKHS